MGYVVEIGLGIGYRDVWIIKIYEGMNEINVMFLVGEFFKCVL